VVQAKQGEQWREEEMALAQAGAPALSAGLFTSQPGLHLDSQVNNKSRVSFASRRSSLAGPAVALYQPNINRSAQFVGAAASRVARAVAAEKNVETAEPAAPSTTSQVSSFVTRIILGKF
jgi:hypothetical protein